MRATRAYITGFGTTGLLIAAAFMTLFVMSAYVAFNGFPGQDVQAPIGSVLLQEHQTPVSVPAVRVKTHVRPSTHTPAVHQQHRAAAKRIRSPQATTTGPVKHRVSTTPAPAQTQTPSTSAGTTKPTTPQLPVTPPSVPTVSLPKVQLPGGVQTPTQVQLPVDTSGVTNTVNNVTNLVSGGK